MSVFLFTQLVDRWIPIDQVHNSGEYSSTVNLFGMVWNVFVCDYQMHVFLDRKKRQIQSKILVARRRALYRLLISKKLHYLDIRLNMSYILFRMNTTNMP